MDFLDGHHYDDKETKENTTCSTEKSRSLLGGEDSGFNLDGQQLRW